MKGKEGKKHTTVSTLPQRICAPKTIPLPLPPSLERPTFFLQLD